MPSTRRRQNAASTCAHSRSRHTITNLPRVGVGVMRTKGATQPQKHRATLPDGSMYAHCSTREVEPTSTIVIPYATSATPPLIKQHYNTNIARERGCHHNPTAQNGHDLRRALHATPKTMVALQTTPTQKAALVRLDTHGAPRHLAITLARAATSYTNGTKRGHCTQMPSQWRNTSYPESDSAQHDPHREPDTSATPNRIADPSKSHRERRKTLPPDGTKPPRLARNADARTFVPLTYPT